jgi:penicillin-binding protein 1A
VTPEVVAQYVERFGIMDDMPPLLSMALGAGETTPLRLATAYGMLVNGGLEITPTLIDRVQDRDGATIFRHDDRACPQCQDVAWSGQSMPQLPDDRERVATAAGTYQIVNILTGAIRSGTGVRLRSLNMSLGGKTGTTNDSQDAWFMAVMPNLVVGVYTGFDTPKPLGPREAGSSVALPIFKLIAERALVDKPQVPFRVPPGVSLVWIDHQTGLRAQPGQEDVILEAFLPGTEPSLGQTTTGPVLDFVEGGQTYGGAPTTTIDGNGSTTTAAPSGLGTQVGEGAASGQDGAGQQGGQAPSGSATSGGLY